MPVRGRTDFVKHLILGAVLRRMCSKGEMSGRIGIFQLGRSHNGTVERGSVRQVVVSLHSVLSRCTSGDLATRR